MNSYKMNGRMVQGENTRKGIVSQAVAPKAKQIGWTIGDVLNMTSLVSEDNITRYSFIERK